MNRICKCEVQKLFPILEAIKEGKTIQFKDSDGWRDIDGDDEGFYLNTLVEETDKYRIKPESKYRPFANKEECWKEMQKHQPFGWIKSNVDKHLYSILAITNNGCVLIDRSIISFQHFYKYNTFADGMPFGFKE